MALDQKRIEMIRWKARQIVQSGKSHLLTDKLMEYSTLAERTWPEVFLWGFFLPGGGFFILRKPRLALGALLAGVALCVVFFSLVLDSFAAALAVWAAYLVLQMTGGVTAAVMTRKVAEEATFRMDELLKSQRVQGNGQQSH